MRAGQSVRVSGFFICMVFAGNTYICIMVSLSAAMQNAINTSEADAIIFDGKAVFDNSLYARLISEEYLWFLAVCKALANYGAAIEMCAPIDCRYLYCDPEKYAHDIINSEWYNAQVTNPLPFNIINKWPI